MKHLLKKKIHSLNNLYIRDPFILPHYAEKCYYLYSHSGNLPEINPNGVIAYKSKDLVHWEGPYVVFQIPPDFWTDSEHNIWAPEVHFYQDKYYLMATITNKKRHLDKKTGRPELFMRGTQIFFSDSPLGPFEPFQSEKPDTPVDWMCLDGTLYIEDNIPYMVFCHEWIQITDGTINAVPLKKDLSGPAGNPITLFKATDATWVINLAE